MVRARFRSPASVPSQFPAPAPPLEWRLAARHSNNSNCVCQSLVHITAPESLWDTSDATVHDTSYQKLSLLVPVHRDKRDSRAFLVATCPRVASSSRQLFSPSPSLRGTTHTPQGYRGAGCVLTRPVTQRNLVDVFQLKISSSEITRSCYQVSLPGSLYRAVHFHVLADLLDFPEVQ